jgi:iron complex transport system ATP-binding protein
MDSATTIKQRVNEPNTSSASNNTAAPLLSITDLSVQRGERTVLKDFNAQVQTGELVVLIGENGAGKSTLIHALAGSIAAKGDITFQNTPLSDWQPSDLAKQRAVMQQHESSMFAFCVAELVKMGRYPYAETNRQQQQSINQYLQAMHLQTFASRPITDLSGGERQRVQMARCLAQLDALAATCKNKLLFLDEPTSALDLRHQHQLLTTVLDFVRQGNSAVVALHDVNLAGLYADRIWLLHNSGLWAQGDPSYVLSQDFLESVYGTRMHIQQHPIHNRPMIFSEPKENLHA